MVNLLSSFDPLKRNIMFVIKSHLLNKKLLFFAYIWLQGFFVFLCVFAIFRYFYALSIFADFVCFNLLFYLFLKSTLCGDKLVKILINLIGIGENHEEKRLFAKIIHFLAKTTILRKSLPIILRLFFEENNKCQCAALNCVCFKILKIVRRFLKFENPFIYWDSMETQCFLKNLAKFR